MRKFETDYRLRDKDNFSAKLFNKILADIDARIAAGEDMSAAVANAISDLNKVGLDRINSVLTPQIERIQLAGELGFLVISSDTPQTLVQGNIVTFVVEEGARRELFHPTTLLDVVRRSTPDDRAVALLHNYDAEYGELLVEFLRVDGDPGPHSDWEICASGGTALVQMRMLESAMSIQEDVVIKRGGCGVC